MYPLELGCFWFVFGMQQNWAHFYILAPFAMRASLNSATFQCGVRKRGDHISREMDSCNDGGRRSPVQRDLNFFTHSVDSRWNGKEVQCDQPVEWLQGHIEYPYIYSVLFQIDDSFMVSLCLCQMIGRIGSS